MAKPTLPGNIHAIELDTITSEDDRYDALITCRWAPDDPDTTEAARRAATD